MVPKDKKVFNFQTTSKDSISKKQNRVDMTVDYFTDVTFTTFAE